MNLGRRGFAKSLAGVVGAFAARHLSVALWLRVGVPTTFELGPTTNMSDWPLVNVPRFQPVRLIVTEPFAAPLTAV